MKKKHIGSHFDEFLQEEGTLAEVEAAAVKRVLSYKLERELSLKKMTKQVLAKKMKTSRSALDRLLEPDNVSVTLLTLEKAALALGKKLKIDFA